MFRDSLQIDFSSLDALAGSLAKSGRENFQHTDQVITSRHANANVELLKRKCIFCYEYLHSYERLVEMALSSRETFLAS